MKRAQHFERRFSVTRQLTYLYYNMRPSMVLTNIIAFSGGFLFALSSYLEIATLLSLLPGVAALVAAACVINNITDREKDKLMTRTRSRPLASGLLSVRSAALQSALLAVVGATLLFNLTNYTVLVLGIGALLFYATVYAALKRRYAYGTLSGAVPGGVVVLSGYAASAGTVDMWGIALFLTVLALLMNSYHKVVRRRQRDYAVAGLPRIARI